jgi:molybdopterin molybdotransferase
MPLEEAIARVVGDIAPLAAEMVPLARSMGRILAAPLSANLNQPPFAASSMDGYAVRACDIETVPAILKQIGEAPAGSAFSGCVGKGQTVRIFTGGPVPEGADCVVIQENTTTNGNAITILESATVGNAIRPLGFDFKHGDVLLDAGCTIGPVQIALAAAMNHGQLPVRKKPKVAIIATGDELVRAGQTPSPHQIISSNGPGIFAAVEAFGGQPVDLGIARDTEASLSEAFAKAEGADLLITLGGASVGDHDIVQDILKQQGVEIDFWRIAMRPGKPLMFGQRGPMRVLGLPGNPVSAMICAQIFVKPVIDAYLDRPYRQTPFRVELGCDLPANDVRQEFMRASLSREDGNIPVATPFRKQDSSLLSRLARADCLVIRPPHAPAAQKGDKACAIPLLC